MTEPIDSIRRAGRVRAFGRRAADRREEDDSPPATANLPAVITPPPASTPHAVEPGPAVTAKPAAAFAAQLIGGGERRGLRGGPQTLDTAKTVYLETEWSGPSDRRRKGRITKTEV